MLLPGYKALLYQVQSTISTKYKYKYRTASFVLLLLLHAVINTIGQTCKETHLEPSNGRLLTFRKQLITKDDSCTHITNIQMTYSSDGQEGLNTSNKH